MTKETKTAWDFVEKYYPKYYSCDEIARVDDLAKLLAHEYGNDDAETLLHDHYQSDIDNPNIQRNYNDMCVIIYEKAMEAFMNSDKEPTPETIHTLDTLIASCNEGMNGEWDTTTEEGKEGFQAMIDDLERIKTAFKKL